MSRRKALLDDLSLNRSRSPHLVQRNCILTIIRSGYL
jgi:hypothetical protein